MYLTKTINGISICYQEAGYADGPVVVLVSGWAHDMRLYDGMMPLLTAKHRVVRLNWRGHGMNRDYTDDFGVEEQVRDTLGLLDALGVDQFYLISHSHGGWPALELADRVGNVRLLALLMIDQIMTAPPPEFAAGLKAIQTPSTWRAGRKDLFEHWLAGSRNEAVHDHLTNCMGSYGFQMWALSCKVIEQAYGANHSPMERMRRITSPPPIRHVFSHPKDSSEYRKLHADFASEYPWFSYSDLRGETHFPSLEMPQEVCQQFEDLISATKK